MKSLRGAALLLLAVFATTATAQYPAKPVKILVPITISAQMPFVVVVSTNAKISALSELLARAKASPAKINYGSAGVGGANHVVTELFKRSAGIDLTHVPFRGMGDAMTGLMAGSVDVL